MPRSFTELQRRSPATTNSVWRLSSVVRWCLDCWRAVSDVRPTRLDCKSGFTPDGHPVDSNSGPLTRRQRDSGFTPDGHPVDSNSARLTSAGPVMNGLFVGHGGTYWRHCLLTQYARLTVDL